MGSANGLWAGVCAVILAAGGETVPACPSTLAGRCFKTPGYRFPSVSTPSDCCQACVSDTHCGAWTYVPAVVEIGGSTSACHLKVAAENDTACSTGTSGIVRNHTLPPISPTPPSPSPGPAPANALSVLFLVVDDLRPELAAAYGQTHLVTPHLDKFAATALTFTRAMVQFSHCSPSRNSFLSGRSPQYTKTYNFINSFRDQGVGENWTALPEFFKNNGYYVAGGGKVYHPGKPPNNDSPRSWDVYFKSNGDDAGCRKNETIYDNVCPSDEPLSSFYDWVLANETVAQLELASRMNKPFFVAAGLRRPHRVWHVPRRFYDMYPNNGTDPIGMPLAKYKTGSVGMPELAYIDNAWPSFDYNQSVPIPDRIAALGRWGYYASVSFTGKCCPTACGMFMRRSACVGDGKHYVSTLLTNAHLCERACGLQTSTWASFCKGWTILGSPIERL